MRINQSLIIALVLLTLSCLRVNGQDSVIYENDTTNLNVLQNINQKLVDAEQQRITDSIKRLELEAQINQLKTTDNLDKASLINQLKKIEQREKNRKAEKVARIDSLRKNAKGYPVIGMLEDTLFFIYSRFGVLSPKERANIIHNKLVQLYDNDFLKPDSISVLSSESSLDIVYGEMILMSVSETDALWYGSELEELANNNRNLLVAALINAQKENQFLKILIRIVLVIIVIIVTWLVFWFIGKGHSKLLRYIHRNQERWLKDLSYKDYTFLSIQQEMSVIHLSLKLFRWFIYFFLLYISLPIVFSIFPFSRHWADALFQLMWSPFKSIILAVWNYLPNLFRILVIYVVMRYVIRFVKYIFHEVESEKLKISGFHADWSMPTYSIIKFLLYAFMFVLIFPYLPGSDSNIFKGVSVFIGILFSLGSSSAIANMIAGLVITYMRPFKIGDRIKIGEVSGDVTEKTLLVTRIRTIKNEIITIPNSSVLTGNTTNYSSEADEKGLIVHTTVTIGYDVPWRVMHEILIDAAIKTEMVMNEPQPFVLQTSLDDFYVSYQLNAYTKEASKQAIIYSSMHQCILDICNERGIEILSPHYRSARDGNDVAIPYDYLPKDYQSKGFKVDFDNKKD